MDRITADEAKGIYTAERCPPEKRDAIIQLLGSGSSKRRIQDLLQVHRLTIVAIEDRFMGEVDAVRQRTSRRLRRCVSDQLDRIEDNPGVIPPSAIPMMVGVFTDKAELLDGRATVRVENVERVDIYGDWDSFVEKQLQPEDVKEIGPGMRLGGEKNPPIEAELAGERDPLQTPGPTDSDNQSGDCQGDKSQCHDLRPDLAARERSGSDRPEDPPGGGSDQPGSQTGPTDKSAQKILANGDDLS